MIKIVALNEESLEESDEEDVHLITREAQEDQAVVQYKEALELQRHGETEKSAAILRELLASSLIQEVEKSSIRQYQPLLALKYSCLKNLANLELKAGNKEDALDFFLQAVRLDDTDVSLLYKVGCLAEQLNRFDLAAVSFHEGLQCSPNHWLCLDRLITVLYATNGYLTCLSFVAKGLGRDPEYTKCLVLRDAMLKESPSLAQHYKEYFPNLPLSMEGTAEETATLEILKEALEMRKNWSASGKIKERGPIGLTRPLGSLTWLCLAEELLRLFKYVSTEGIDATSSQKVDFERIEEIVAEFTFNDNDEEMDVDDRSEKQDENEEANSNGSRKHRKRLFLENWVLGGQRRSARVRTTTRKDEDTSLADSLKRLIPMSLLPDCLKDGGQRLMLDDNSMDTMDMFKIFEEKNQNPLRVSSRRPSANTVASIAENIAKEEYFGTEIEKQEVTAFIEEHKENWGVYNLIIDYVKIVVSKCKLTWPHKLVSAWIDCYQIMRKSLVHAAPLSKEIDDCELEEDARLSFLHAELLSDRLKRQKGRSPPMVLLDDLAQLQLMTCWTAEEAVTVNWLRAHVALLQKNTDWACSSLRAVIEQLEMFPDGITLVNCKGTINKDETEHLLSSLECSQSLAGAEQFWRQGMWKQLADLLEGSFQVQSQFEFRHIQLEMFADALVRLEDPLRSFLWAEASLHESVAHYLNNQQPEWASCIEKILACLVYCLDEYGMESTIGSLPSGRLSRLFQDLCQIVCAQLETTEMVMPIESVDPWILLQQILAHEEQNRTTFELQAVNEGDEPDEIPASISVLFVAHEHLGRRSWCCADDGSLLLFALDQIVPKLKSEEFASFRSKLSPHIEQMFFCLYEYPTTKKPKGRSALQEHSVPHIELTFERAQLLLEFYRPDELPEFDSYRVGSISVDAENLIKKIITLAPQECNPQKTLENLRLWIEGKLEKFPPTEHKLLPEGLKDINYLLADYYFKNNELPKAVRYYMLDLCHNPSRLDAWAGMALARGSQLETQLNSCSAINETDFIKRAEKAEKCYEQVMKLSEGRHTVICIEYGSFVYMIHSYCARLLKQATDTLSIEQFEILENKKSSALDTAESCFKKAMNAWTQGSEEDQDERWLHHYMLGKASEKRHQDPWQALEQYLESAKLLSEHKSAYPVKVSYTNPTELSIEALEVHYRIHTCILKHLEFHEGKTLPNAQKLKKILLGQQQGPFGADNKDDSRKRKAELEPGDVSKKPKQDEGLLGTAQPEENQDEPARRVSQESSTTITTSTSHSTSSSSSSSDDSSSSSSENEKQAETVPKVEEQFDPLKDHGELVDLCLAALEDCAIRFPEHYKSLYRLAQYHFKSKLRKDVNKCKNFLLGPHPNTKLHGLFQDRKPSNFFNGVWRIPVNEIDRPGCFASHMYRSMVLLMELVKETKDYRMLVDLCLQLKRTPDPDKKYLRDNERKDLSEQALLLAVQVIRQVLKDSKPEELVSLIVEIYKMMQKVQRVQQNKEPQALGKLLCDSYSLHLLGKIDPKATTIDAAMKFAQQELARAKMAAKAAEITSIASNSSASVSDSNVPSMATPVMPMPIRKPPAMPGTSRRGRPPLSRPPGTTSGRGRAKSSPYSNYFPNPFGQLDTASLGYLQNELMRQMMQGYTAALTSAVSQVPAMQSMQSMAANAAMSSMSSMAGTSAQQGLANNSPMQKIAKSRPNLSVTPVGLEKPKSLPKHNTQKTVKRLLEQSRKMLETASRMQQSPRKQSPLPHLPPGIVASAIPKQSSGPVRSAAPGPSMSKKPLMGPDTPVTLTKLPSGGRNSPISLVKPRQSSPVELIRKMPTPKGYSPRPQVPQGWPSGGLPKQMQRNLPPKKQHLQRPMGSAHHTSAPFAPRPSTSSQSHPKPQPAHMASRMPSALAASVKDFHFPSDISVSHSVIQHTKQHQQFNLPSSISVTPAPIQPPKQLPPPKPPTPKEQPKRKLSDDIIILD
ncbi:calcineurin-binding protein cabin-1-like [Neocloeon triangulifer]|uniref:calcineurin-binding protein cabin-1-like n=1 Tax=Neocloeon triangulifer TaxID=2078957 RepID=UPI00286F4E9A|nr:calcineurin-binding protein cabin-1-like [Neocloeon triangulifer]